MSEEAGPTLTSSLVTIMGFVVLVLGGMLTYFSLTTVGGIVNPQLFTPLGIIVSIIGLLMIITKKT